MKSDARVGPNQAVTWGQVKLPFSVVAFASANHQARRASAL